MTAHKMICAVIPEREDDAVADKFLVVAPEDRIVWVTTTQPNRRPDFSPEERKRAVTQAGIQSMINKMSQEHEQEALDESDAHLDYLLLRDEDD